MPRLGRAWLGLALLWVALAAAPAQPQQAPLAVAPLPHATQISPTIYVSGIQDLLPDASGSSKCSALVDRAASYSTFGQAQFLLSHLWWDSGPADPPPGWDGCANYTLSTYYW